MVKRKTMRKMSSPFIAPKMNLKMILEMNSIWTKCTLKKSQKNTVKIYHTRIQVLKSYNQIKQKQKVHIFVPVQIRQNIPLCAPVEVEKEHLS